MSGEGGGGAVWDTYGDEELLDLVHGVGHSQVGLGNGSHHLDEHVQLHAQVGVFGLTTFPQLFLLRVTKGSNVIVFLMNPEIAKQHRSLTCVWSASYLDLVPHGSFAKH